MQAKDERLKKPGLFAERYLGLFVHKLAIGTQILMCHDVFTPRSPASSDHAVVAPKAKSVITDHHRTEHMPYSVWVFTYLMLQREAPKT